MTFDTSTYSVSGDAAADEPVFLEIEDDETSAATTPDEGVEPSAPGWFSRKRAKAAKSSSATARKGRTKSSLPAIAARPEDQAGVVWQEPSLLKKLTYILRGEKAYDNGDIENRNPGYLRFKRLLAFAMTGYGVSLIFHSLVTGALALVVFEATKSGDLNLFASQAADDIVEFDEIDTALDVSGGAQEQLELPQLEVVKIPSTEFVQPTVPNEMSLSDVAKGDGEGNSDGNGSGPRFRMPAAGKAVTKGSFTVWTVPEDPEPGQNYHIIVQVKLPDGVKRFRRSDLSGIVVGTDGYRQPIPGYNRGWVKVQDNKAQVAVFVPAASSLVRDKIQVRSKILKEQQDLEIVF